MSLNPSSGQGALFELVARGMKDAYFVKDAPQSVFPYDARYQSSTPHLAERRTAVPLSAAAFGGSFEFEIDPYGDVLTECALEIELPTWLPPLPIVAQSELTVAPEIVNRLFSITADDGFNEGPSYGYVNYAGYFLFEKIQFYQDQFLIQEWSGDGLLAKEMTEGSWGSAFLRQELGGATTNVSPVREIQLRATPQRLRVILPLPGTQCPQDAGFPLCATPWQSFRIKGVLRKLEDLVVCSDPTVFKPSPWAVPQMTVRYDDGSTHSFAPLGRIQMAAPSLFLSTVQHYVSPEAQNELRTSTLEIPFRKTFENVFTFGELDFISLDKGGAATVTRRLDARHPAERLFWFFRNTNALNNNRLDDWHNDYFDDKGTTAAQPYTVPYGEFYYSVKLNIAGKEREDAYGPLVTSQMVQLVKDERANGMHIGGMNWSTGEKYGVVYPAERQPEGTVNFTTADRPTLLISLANANTNPYLSQRKVEMRAFVEGWNAYVVKEGRGKMMFAS